MDRKCAILMASYNGARYIKKQIQSIRTQTFENWILYIRDDGSNDGTIEIIKEFMELDSRIKLIDYPSEYHGAFINFHYLIEFVRQQEQFDYYYFCDQDDIWDNNKIEVMNSRFIDDKIPQLLYSDMRIIDGEDSLISDSSDNERGLRLPNRYQLFFTHSYIWGCSVAINKSLLALVPEFDIADNLSITKILSHDNLFAKFALIWGKVSFIEIPLISYRRHYNNVSEINKSNVSLRDLVVAFRGGISKIAKKHANGYSQTLFMIELAKKNNLVASKLNEIENILSTGGLKAIIYLINKKVRREQLSKTIIMYYIVLFRVYVKYLVDWR